MPKGNRSQSDMELIKKDFMLQMGNGEFRRLGHQAKADEIGCSMSTIIRWVGEIGDKEWAKWREEDEKQLVRKEICVDDALYEKACDGDVNAMKLWYQKKAGWSEKTTQENINRGPERQLSDEELIARFKAVKANGGVVDIGVVGDGASTQSTGS